MNMQLSLYYTFWCFNDNPSQQIRRKLITIIYFAIVSAALLLMTVNADNSEDSARTDQAYFNARRYAWHRIDPRLELLACNTSAAVKWSSRFRWYAQSIDTWFADFKSRSAVRLKSLENTVIIWPAGKQLLCFDGVPFDREPSRIGYRRKWTKNGGESHPGGSGRVLLKPQHFVNQWFWRLVWISASISSKRPSRKLLLACFKDDMIRLLIDWYGYEHERYACHLFTFWRRLWYQPHEYTKQNPYILCHNVLHQR